MDNLGKGVGHVGVDGAFERFLTAAIATIITIMFSWRLLAEENENFGDIPPGAVGRTPTLMYIGSRKRDEDDDEEQNTSIGISENKTVESGRPFKDQNGICHFDVDGDEKQPEGVMSGLTTNSLDGDIDEPPDYDSSWADYDPDEDMYGEFHTRRSVRDFITTENKDRKKDRYSFSDSDTEVSENIVPTSHEYLEQLYVNKEYSSITEGDVNLNEQIGDDSCDSESESESDEGEYEPPMVDSDEEPYYPSVLEPIIEEDSDDSVENDEKHEIVSKKSKRPSEPKTGSRHFGIKPDQGGNLVSKSGSGEITEADDQINHVDLFTSEQSTHLETCEYENQSELRNKPPHLDFIEIENQNIEDVEIDDSLPASPIRTSALDDKDGYFSDESCSSSSVVTVVSLPTYERRKLNENICSDSLDLSNNETSIKTDKLVDTCLPSQEHLNTGGGHVPDQIKNDIIAFIHGVPDQSTETNHDTSKLNTFLNNDSIEGDQNLDLNVTETTGTPDSVYTQNHKHGSDKTAEKLGKHVGISYNDFVTDLELNGKENFNSETNVSETDKTNDNQDSVTDQENIDVSEEEVSLESPLNTSLDNIDVPDEIYNHVDQKEGEKTDTEVNKQSEGKQENTEGSGSPVVYPESDEEPREFPIDIDSDEGPREYNPDEDDFARFNSDLDSDEDSFYLLIGGNENLRKLETFTNLNVVGLSPGAYSGDEVTYFDESEKKIVFSRTEEVVTDHSVKCYVKDREASADKLAEISEVNDSGSEDKHNKSFEEEQKEILDDLELLLEIESEKEETINEVKSEEVKIDTAFDDIDQNSNVKLGEISDINSNSVDIDQLKEQVSELLNNCETVNEVETKSETSLPPRKDSDKETENLSPQQREDSAENDKQLSPDRSYETVRKLNSENTGAETVIPGDIKLSTDDQINESVGVSNTEVGVVIDESEQQVADLIECKTNVNNKSNLIDNKTNSHEEALTFTKSLNHNSEASVCSNDFKNNVSNENQCETSNSVSNSEIKTNVKNNSHSGNNEGRLIPIAFDTLVDEKVPISVSEIKSENQKSDRVSENLIFSQNSKNNENEEDGLEKVAFENLVDEKVSKVSSSIFDFKLVNPKCNEVSENLNSNKNSKSVEDVTIGKLEESIKPCIDILSNSVQTNNNSNIKESETRKSEIPKVKNCIESLKSNSGKESNSSSGASREIKSSGYKPGASRDYNSLPNFSSRVVHTSAQRPSGYKGVKGKITKQLQYKPKQYSSVLQQPIIIETHKSVVIDTPEKSLPKSRQKILVSRKRFLSEENLSTLPKPFKDPFSQHKASFTKTAPRQRRYAKRDENSAQARRNLSFDRIDRLRDLCQSPRISEDSFEKPEIDNLHADCIFSPHKHEQIMNTTLSIDNLHAQLLRYGSVASLVETDIDSGETFETRIFPETDIDEHDFHFQVPLQRTASMSELGNRTKPRRGRFADRNVPKSKSLQTLETNIDDVFTAEGQGNLARVPSVHELRVSKSLSKLNVPDWYKKSSVSRSGSTFSLYSSRRDSTSTINSFGQPPSLTTSPCPSVTPGSNAVVIRTRVTPSSAKLVRAPLLPTTPEKSPLPPSILKLPSDKFRQKEQPKQLMPIPIVPFSKLRLMFESKSKKDKTRTKESDIKSPISPLPKSALKSPTSPEVPNISKTLSVTPSAKENSIIESEILVAQKSPTASISPSSTMTDSHQKRTIEPVKNGRILHSDTNKPQVPDKPKSLLVNTVAPQHNTEPPAPSREHNSTKHVRYSIPSQSQHPPVQKEQVSRRLAPPVAMVQPQSQSRKGKVYDINDNETLTQYSGNSYEYRDNNNDNLQGELLFDFLQKLRYSRLQENVFTDQLPTDMDSETDGHYRFPILSVNQHSPGFKQSRDDLTTDVGSLQVVFADAPLNGGIDNTNLKDASLEEVLSGLLALNEKKKSSSKNSDNEIFSRKISDESQSSLSPPWSLGPVFNSISSDSDKSPTTPDYYDNVFEEDESVTVRCKNCRRKSLLKYARVSYKTCHNCYTYYCSRHCRKLDWENHKHKCALSLINSLCKRVIKFVNRESHTQYHFSRAARRGYLSQGRGALVLAFSDLVCAENFLVHGVHSLWMPPVFLSLNNLNDAHMLKDSVGDLVAMCSSFNPELKFVLHVIIPVPKNIPQKPIPRKNVSLVQRTAKLRLSPAHMHPESKESEESSTLILTAVPGGPDVNSNCERRSREVCFVNIQRKLRERGVSLRHHYPEVYDKLIEYVADAKHFSPMIIYPYDNRTRKRFMCVIMPESEPEIEWVQEKTLLDELDINEDFCREGIYSTSISSLTDVPDTPL